MKFAVALALLALPLSACGASLDAVAKAATNATSKGSEHITFTGTVSAAGQTVKMTGSGDFRNTPKLGGMHLSLVAAGKRIVMDEVMQGTTVYLKSPLFTSHLPAGKSWVFVDLQKAGAKQGIDFSKFTQQDPTDILGALKKAASVKKIGAEVVDGIDTTHYRATIDLAKAPNGSQLQKLANLKALPVDVWVDRKDQLVRMTESFSTTTSGSTVSTIMQMDFADYGERVNVTVPTAAQSVDMTSLGG